MATKLEGGNLSVRAAKKITFFAASLKPYKIKNDLSYILVYLYNVNRPFISFHN